MSKSNKRVGPVVVNANSRTVSHDWRSERLSSTELKIIHAIHARAGRYVTCDDMIPTLWPDDRPQRARAAASIKVMISKVRAKLRNIGVADLIESDGRGPGHCGYIIRSPD